MIIEKFSKGSDVKVYIEMEEELSLFNDDKDRIIIHFLIYNCVKNSDLKLEGEKLAKMDIINIFSENNTRLAAMIGCQYIQYFTDDDKTLKCKIIIGKFTSHSNQNSITLSTGVSNQKLFSMNSQTNIRSSTTIKIIPNQEANNEIEDYDMTLDECTIKREIKYMDTLQLPDKDGEGSPIETAAMVELCFCAKIFLIINDTKIGEWYKEWLKSPVSVQ